MIRALKGPDLISNKSTRRWNTILFQEAALSAHKRDGTWLQREARSRTLQQRDVLPKTEQDLIFVFSKYQSPVLSTPKLKETLSGITTCLAFTKQKIKIPIRIQSCVLVWQGFCSSICFFNQTHRVYFWHVQPRLSNFLYAPLHLLVQTWMNSVCHYGQLTAIYFT